LRKRHLLTSSTNTVSEPPPDSPVLTPHVSEIGTVTNNDRNLLARSPLIYAPPEALSKEALLERQLGDFYLPPRRAKKPSNHAYNTTITHNNTPVHSSNKSHNDRNSSSNSTRSNARGRGSGTNGRGKRNKGADTSTSNTLYCVCKQPYDQNADFMIGCDVCNEWYHGSCVGVTQKESKKNR